MLRPLSTQGSCRLARKKFFRGAECRGSCMPLIARRRHCYAVRPQSGWEWNLRPFPHQVAVHITGKETSMERIEKSIEVAAPVRAAYNQWTQFEEFPRFMAGVKEVRQLDDTHVHWHAEIWGKDKEWDAEITEQVPDQVIAWRSRSGAPNAGTVRFEPVDARAHARPADDGVPAGRRGREDRRRGRRLQRRVQNTVEDFKKFIEARRRDRRLARRSPRRAENAYFKTARTRADPDSEQHHVAGREGGQPMEHVVVGEVDEAVHRARRDVSPGQGDRSHIHRAERVQHHARHVEEQRHLQQIDVAAARRPRLRRHAVRIRRSGNP